MDSTEQNNNRSGFIGAFHLVLVEDPDSLLEEAPSQLLCLHQAAETLP